MFVMAMLNPTWSPVFTTGRSGVLTTSRSGQLSMLMATGAMKSFISAENDADDRLLTYARPKCVHSLAENTPAAVKLMAASPNVLSASTRGAPGGIGSVTLNPSLTAPSANPAADRLVSGPHCPLASHRRILRTTLLPPLAKSKLMSMSPAVRWGVSWLAEVDVLWLNSKSMFAEPRVLARSHPRYKKMLSLAISWET